MILNLFKFMSHLNFLNETLSSSRGKIGWVLLWLVGIPIPVLLVLFVLRGCT